jgi:hypothetical protein
MQIMVLPDGRTAGPLRGCEIHRVDTAEGRAVAEILAGGLGEPVARFGDVYGAAPIEAAFEFARHPAEADLRNNQDALWPVNAYSDADELRALLEAAQGTGLIVASLPGATLSVRPSSISRPLPLLTVGLGGDRTVLGSELRLDEHDDEDPIAFTLRLLEEAVIGANRLVCDGFADSALLDRLAAFLNRPGPWSGSDVCELLAGELERSGRRILANAEH